MELYKTFFVTYYSTKLDVNNINDTLKNKASSIDKGVIAKEKVVAPICGEITLPKKSIKTQKLTNGTKLITQSEAPASEVILVEKFRTDISVNSWLIGETREIVTQEKHIPKKEKKYIKPLAMYPPRKDPIPNQDKKNLGLPKCQHLPSHVPTFSSVFKPLRNE